MHANDDHQLLKKRQPIPRLAQVSEIVDALLYLQSAPMVNGEYIRIDGGPMLAPSGNQRITTPNLHVHKLGTGFANVSDNAE
jgi:hypothetical protein